MEKKPTLTIDAAATKEKILKDGRFVASYGQVRGQQHGFSASAFTQIVAGDYPHQDKYDSVYQRVLRVLQADGYLVQKSEEGRTPALSQAGVAHQVQAA